MRYSGLSLPRRPGSSSRVVQRVSMPSVVMSNFVGGAEIGGLLAKRPLEIAQRGHGRALHALRADHPTQRAALGADGFLQQYETFFEGVRPWRTSGDVDVHRQKFVDALHHAVD